MRPALIIAMALASAGPVMGQQSIADFMSPPPAGFLGTAFRGVALGQSRAEVEAALYAIGMRCAVDADFASFNGSVRNPAPIAQHPVTPCWFVPNTSALGATDMQRLSGAVNVSESFMTPYQAVWFIDGRATSIGLDIGYFNATGMTTYQLAVSLVENYDFPHGMQPAGSGYTGLTDRDEKVVIADFLEFKLINISLVGGASQPTFN